MPNRHEPRDAFVSGLEDRLRAEFARRPRATFAPWWMPRSTRGLAFGAATLVIVSIAIGGGVVALAYEAQQNELRNMLVGTYQQRLALATQGAELARQRLREVEQRVATGGEPSSASIDARSKVSEAEAAVRILEIDLVEVRATGREPMTTVSAPLVSGRDLVSDRWRIEMSVMAAALESAKRHVSAMRVRFDVGLAKPEDVDAADARQIELESSIRLAEQKIQVRQMFLSGSIPATAAELRVLESETEQRRAALVQRIEVARRRMADLRSRVEIGTLNPLDVAEAEMRVLELQLALKRAEYDLALIRKQLGK